MSERTDLLASISGIILDYRAGEIVEPTPQHVDRWIRQFDMSAQVPLLREFDHVLKHTYFSREFLRQFFADQIKNDELTGKAPCSFWQSAHILDIQQHGHSQSEIRELFGKALKRECGLEIENCGSTAGAFVYLDDVLFSGARIGNDLSTWIEHEAPAKGAVHVVVIAAHSYGEWQCRERLQKAAVAAGKELVFRFWAAECFENRKKYRNKSEVLWPVSLPDDATLEAYVAEELRFPFEPRQVQSKLGQPPFSSEEGRQLLERELLVAGIRIRSFSENPNHMLRPLGFSSFGLGFGSLIVTFRNCPNNTPLALWWGDPDAPPGHPFREWYPLLPRKTYVQ
jgi:hypothetical protein